MRALILAAGRGERLRPLTDETPKPLLPVGGKPLIEWHIERLATAGFRQLVINLGWLGAQIPRALGDGSRWGAQIAYSDETGFDEPLETGGGMHHALPLLGDGPFLVVNGDTWSTIDVAELPVPSDNHLAHLVLTTNPPWHPAGDFALADGLVVDTGTPRFTFTGTAVYHPGLFDRCAPGRFSVVPLLRDAMAQQRVSGQLHNGAWHDAGTPERLRQLDVALRSGSDILR